MTATADKAVTAGSETLIPASSRVSLLVGEEHQIDLLLPAAVSLIIPVSPETRKPRRLRGHKCAASVEHR